MENKTNLAIIRQSELMHVLAALFMAACFVAAWWFIPHKTWYEHLGSPQFKEIIPEKFGDWTATMEGEGSFIVDPQKQEAIDNLYSQMINRTYLHKPDGRRIMLSLAYGDIQTYARQLHRPEACYSSQGFKIQNLHEEKLHVDGKAISVNRMTAITGGRLEQITYWIRIGDKVISGPATALNFERMNMGLKGYVADGLLFRVSELGQEANISDPLQDQFINNLLQALTPIQKSMLIGQNF